MGHATHAISAMLFLAQQNINFRIASRIANKQTDGTNELTMGLCKIMLIYDPQR